MPAGENVPERTDRRKALFFVFFFFFFFFKNPQLRALAARALVLGDWPRRDAGGFDLGSKVRLVRGLAREAGWPARCLKISAPGAFRMKDPIGNVRFSS